MSPSFDCVHDSARLGVHALPGIGFTSASWSAYSIRKGVMTPAVSAGSNHVGASEIWTASVICPSAARAGGGAGQRARAPRGPGPR